ncbi:bacterial transcriptional activator domain-containing protein [Streptomyces sp. NBC_00287]|uniref:bacterial transcriptional activator domain-containing protein n=1 Tax=Streptomyces sp. NBC_00287 TaxID=2975702 RepID=UPI002E2C4F10|nr:bacterial transcriptional activator domain-containing protein [Streptomyces sp. NBC_00287]
MASPTRPWPARLRHAPAAVLLSTGLLLGPHPPAAAQPTPTPTEQPPLTLDRDDPVLALPDGATLAAPKILELDVTRLTIQQLVEHRPAGGQKDETAAPAPSASAPAAQQPGRGPSNTPSAAETPAPTASASLLPAPPSRQARPPATSPPSSPPASAPTVGVPVLRTVLGAGALLAALLTALLALRLHRRAARTTARTHPPHPHVPTQGAEEAGTARADTDRLDTALRTLAHHHRVHHTGHKPPALRAACIAAGSLQVLPQDKRLAPQPPFTRKRRGWWTLPDNAMLLDDEDARTVPAPYPGLVTVGTTNHGDLLLLNLAQLPALLLEGSPDHITEVCNSLTLETLLSPWAAETELWAIGFGDDLPHMLPTRPITHLPHAGRALRHLTERLLELHQQPPNARPAPLLVCAPTLDAYTAQQFAGLIATTDHAPVTLIAPAHTAAAHLPTAQILDASRSGPQQLRCARTRITLQRLPHPDYRQIIQALADAAESGPPSNAGHHTGPGGHENAPRPAIASHPTGDNTPQPEPTADDGMIFPALLAATGQDQSPGPTPSRHPHPPAAAHPQPIPAHPAPPRTYGPARSNPAPPAGAKTAQGHSSGVRAGVDDAQAPELRVLGPVEMDRVATTGHGPRQAQLAALLYFRPGRNADALCTHMDPTRPWTTRTLNARLQGLRRALGNDPNGHPYVPRRHTADDPYRLSPHVQCDWTRFRTLTDHALTQGPAGLPDLEQALALVRSRPFGNRPLPWQEPHQQEMTTHIITVAHTIAAHRTPPGPHHHLTTARQAIATALDVDDTAEILYRDWMRIEAQAGNRQGLHTALTRLQHINTSLGCPLEPETEDLIATLLHHTGPDPTHHP